MKRALLIALFAASPALAQVTPVLDCWSDTGTTKTIILGYVNASASSVLIPIGPSNYFTPGPESRGQVTTFQPGTHVGAMTITVTDAEAVGLTWHLLGETLAIDFSPATMCAECFCPAGPMGPEGDAGPEGPVGPQGIAGPQGPDGEAGPTGPDGSDGPIGAEGATGAAGPAGVQGIAGVAGPQGLQGPAGAAGPQGVAGVAGAVGETGPAGAEGAPGPQGVAGAAGPRGADGVAGPMGASGPQGEVGVAGPAGPPGAAGPVGETGDPGPAGVPGPIGVAGSAGAAGPRGDAGQPGAMGPAGDRGPDGRSPILSAASMRGASAKNATTIETETDATLVILGSVVARSSGGGAIEIVIGERATGIAARVPGGGWTSIPIMARRSVIAGVHSVTLRATEGTELGDASLSILVTDEVPRARRRIVGR